MLVKELIKELKKVDQNLPVIGWEATLDNVLSCGFGEYDRIETIELKKGKRKDLYQKAKSSDKKTITAVRILYKGSIV
jgi:hypothetical protein